MYSSDTTPGTKVIMIQKALILTTVFLCFLGTCVASFLEVRRKYVKLVNHDM